MLKVVKFGGSSLANAEQFEKVAAIINADDTRKYVIPSAPGKRFNDDTKVTDMLYKCHKMAKAGEDISDILAQIKERYDDIIKGLKLDMTLDKEFEIIKSNVHIQEADYAASRGEYLNGIIMAKLLDAEFVDAAEIISFDVDGEYVPDKTAKQIQKRLSKTQRAVVPGFYGAMPDGSIKTFSRGGSDITGSLVAAAMHADLYENWTDVSGVMVADPRIINNPQNIDVITYTELRELSYMGASVLHEDAIFPVRIEGIPINIRNTNAPDDDGTMIVANTCQSPMYTITGIAGKKGFVSVNMEKDKMNNQVGFVRRVLQVFEDNNISIEHMPSGIDTLSVFVHQEEFIEKEQKILQGISRAVNPDVLELESDLALIAIVGRGMKSNRGTAGRIFSALAHARINVKMIDQGSSELNIIVGVQKSDFEAAIRAIYNIFVVVQL